MFGVIPKKDTNPALLMFTLLSLVISIALSLLLYGQSKVSDHKSEQIKSLQKENFNQMRENETLVDAIATVLVLMDKPEV